MEAIQVSITISTAKARCCFPLTVGMVGLPVEFTFDEMWSSLNRTAVFKAGGVVKDRINIDTETTVPPEVMKQTGCQLQIGVEGYSTDGTLVIPTVWVSVGTIQPGADPSGDESTDPALPVWLQIKQIAEAAKEQITALEQNAIAATTEGGVVLGDLASNAAIGENCIAAGADLVSGLRGYYIKAVNFDTNAVYLSAELVAPTITSEDLTDATFETPAYAAGDMISIIKEGNSHWLLCGEIVSIEHNKVICSELPFAEIDSSYYYSFSVRDKPLVGALPLTYAVFVAGGNNIMAGKYGFGGGYGNRGYGDYSFVAGKDNEVGYCAGSLGKSNIVMGYMAFAIGWENEASGEVAFAGGYRTKARARAAAVFGWGNVANNEGVFVIGNGCIGNGRYQFVGGRYNIPDTTSIVIFGNGTNDSNRSNAFKLAQNGNAWFAGKVTAGADPTSPMDTVTLQYLNGVVGDLETALDSIIALQERYIGGETV